MKLFSLLAAAGGANAAYTVLATNYSPSNFFDYFAFYTGADPTNGFVQYIGRDSAVNQGIISQGNTAYIGVDKTNVANNGRQSVRLESKARYTRGLYVLDLAHMPTGCGTWPAFWTLGDNWPNNGEIDVIEGVHEQIGNNVALHTSDGCTVSGSGQTGQVLTTNCYVSAPNQSSNQGCASHDNRANSYGGAFNSNGGGVYAMEWNSDFIKVWFFPRGSIPADALAGNPEPANWGTPVAMYQGSCNINSKFNAHRIIFNITFCGDWAGSVWGSSGCQSRAATCNEYVAANPGAFSEAYFRVNSLKVWSS
ncbi:concanavalin A-like lectin/glucanase domain-containing protein [Geopyxis carbonaria]|nr:concanavalin A-like lectin/glucanase domain-containing protein [Geopyxis carbonaria]